MRTVSRFTYLLDAQLDQMKLRSCGIESFIADEHTVTAKWLYADAIGGIRLQVLDADFERAFEILKLVDPPSEDALVCEKCGSFENFRMKLSPWVLPLWLLGMFFPIPSKKRICIDCGAKVKS